MQLLSLFAAFCKIGAFSFGGGYAAIPLIEVEVVRIHAWMSLHQFADLIAISQLTPGPIAINSATFIGYGVAGLPGSIVATVGVLMVPVMAVLLLWAVADRFYHSPWIKGALLGLKPALVALIFYSAYSIGRVAFDSPGPIIIAVIAFGVLRFFSIHPAILIVVSGVFGFLLL
ncbi:chromate transporter [Marispirochaeta sp.]|jgi:chromate transporter|uniref:chromate transporter n=1 Tax=Marispirochaeta sp. TaxID=2038653 RepID=UPI0029C6CBD8|nr:chromate transporter [Marispirochaeta sp.]